MLTVTYVLGYGLLAMVCAYGWTTASEENTKTVARWLSALTYKLEKLAKEQEEEHSASQDR